MFRIQNKSEQFFLDKKFSKAVDLKQSRHKNNYCLKNCGVHYTLTNFIVFLEL